MDNLHSGVYKNRKPAEAGFLLAGVLHKREDLEALVWPLTAPFAPFSRTQTIQVPISFEDRVH